MPALSKLAVPDVFWDAIIFHSMNVACKTCFTTEYLIPSLGLPGAGHPVVYRHV